MTLKILAGILLYTVLFGALTPIVLAAEQDTAEPDSWSSIVGLVNSTLQPGTKLFFAPVHAALTPDSKVMFLGYSRNQYSPTTPPGPFQSFTIVPEPLGAPIPAEMEVSVITVPFTPVPGGTDSLYCAANTFTGTGELFTAGGVRTLPNGNRWGLPYAMTYNSGSSQWSRIAQNMKGSIPGGAEMPGSRWYPTATHLWDDQMLVTAGFEDAEGNIGTANLTLEIFNAISKTWTVISSAPASSNSWGVRSPTWTPREITHSDYTFTWQLPSQLNGLYDLLMFGEFGYPIKMALPPLSISQRWVVDNNNPRPGTPDFPTGGFPSKSPNYGASSALLPIRLSGSSWGYGPGSIMIAGGDRKLGPEYNGHIKNIDFYDPNTSLWGTQLKLFSERHHPSIVLLPDGKELIVGGHDYAINANVKYAEYYDPQTATTSVGTNQSAEVRGYHSVALLLPDGRVLVGGGTDTGVATTEKANFEYYYPPYMSKNRPSIDSATTTINYNSDFGINYTSTNPISEVVLMALGAHTHSFDQNQRYIQLNIASLGSNSLIATGPPSSRTAPPGYYMLFVLDNDRTPSVATIVQLK